MNHQQVKDRADAIKSWGKEHISPSFSVKAEVDGVIVGLGSVPSSPEDVCKLPQRVLGLHQKLVQEGLLQPDAKPQLRVRNDKPSVCDTDIYRAGISDLEQAGIGTGHLDEFLREREGSRAIHDERSSVELVIRPEEIPSEIIVQRERATQVIETLKVVLNGTVDNHSWQYSNDGKGLSVSLLTVQEEQYDFEVIDEEGKFSHDQLEDVLVQQSDITLVQGLLTTIAQRLHTAGLRDAPDFPVTLSADQPFSFDDSLEIEVRISFPTDSIGSLVDVQERIESIHDYSENLREVETIAPVIEGWLRSISQTMQITTPFTINQIKSPCFENPHHFVVDIKCEDMSERDKLISLLTEHGVRCEPVDSAVIRRRGNRKANWQVVRILNMQQPEFKNILLESSGLLDDV